MAIITLPFTFQGLRSRAAATQLANNQAQQIMFNQQFMNQFYSNAFGSITVSAPTPKRMPHLLSKEYCEERINGD